MGTVSIFGKEGFKVRGPKISNDSEVAAIAAGQGQGDRCGWPEKPTVSCVCLYFLFMYVCM